MNRVRIDKLNLDSKKPQECSSNFITAFVDGSHCPKTEAWGVGVWIKHNSNKGDIISEGGKGFKSALQTESFGLELLKKRLLENYDLEGKVIIIQCDCIPALNKFKYQDLMTIGKANYVKLKHVKAHSNNKTKRSYINELVDKVAYREMKKWRSKDE